MRLSNSCAAGACDSFAEPRHRIADCVARALDDVVRQLNAVMVPYVEAPLGANLVVLGSALVFATAVYLLARAVGSNRG